MKKKNLLLKGLLLLTITFGMSGCAISEDDKDNEIVKDPLNTESEYFITGAVTNSNGVMTNVTISASDNNKATTDSKGVYTLKVSEAKSYKLTFTADGYETFTTNADFASGASNRSITTVNVKMSKVITFGPQYAANGATIEVPKADSPTQEIVGVISIPMGGTDVETKIASVAFEEARVAAPATSVQPEVTQAAASNISIKSTPSDAKAKEEIKIEIPNRSPQASQGYFDLASMTVESANLPNTRAASPSVGFENNKYIITIPEGEKIAGKYSLRVKFTKQADKAITDKYNVVNGKAEVLKIENKDYSALTNIELKVKLKNGWDYMTSPAKVLKDAGASEALATEINKFIEDEEGGVSGSYELEETLTTSISGNHVLYYGSKSLIRMKTYTFKVIVNGTKKDIVIKLKSYVGHKEEYTNNPISQHSGGSTGNQN